MTDQTTGLLPDPRPQLVMNPFVDLHVHPQPTALPIDPDEIEVITLRCPVRGEPLRVRELTRAGDPEVFGFFADLAAGGGETALDSDAPVIPALVDLGFLVTPEHIVTHPRYAVALPPPGAAEPGSDWVIAPEFRYQADFALHPAVTWPADYDEQDGRLAVFAPGPAIWVGDPETLTSPYWVDPDDAEAMAQLAVGDPAPPQPLAGRLAAVGALVPPGWPAGASLAARPTVDATPRWAKPPAIAAAREPFAAEQVAVVPGFLPADELAAVNAYYTAMLDEGLLPFGDRQNGRRYSLYDDPLGRFLHVRYAATFAAVAGQPLRPSFCYFFSYVAGAELLAHKDRPQAEFSISLQLRHEPAPDAGGPTGWPLRFRFDDGRTTAAELGVGDAVLYHGREVTHYRDPLPAGQQSSLLVLEYVRPDFDGLLA